MNKLPSSLARPVMILAVALFAVAGARAMTVVDFDGFANSYGATLNFAAPANVAGTNDYVLGYSSTTPLSPVGYTGPAIYGGYWMNSSNGSIKTLTARVRKDFDTNTTPSTHYNSQIELGFATHSGINTTGASFIAFQTGGAYSVGGSSSLNLTISTGSQSTVRFALESGGQWYISSASVNPASSTGGLLSLSGASLQGSEWSLWDPSGGANGRLEGVPTDSSAFDVAGSSFNDIEAVGYFTTYNSTTSNQYADVGQFSADLNPAVVPEPSTVAMLSLGAVVLFLMVRRQRRDLLTGKR